MPPPSHRVLLAQLCKSCPSLKRQLVLQVGRKGRRECLGRRQQERCTASLLEESRGLEELPEPLAGAEGMQGTDSSRGEKGGQWHGRPAHGTGVHGKQGAHTVPGLETRNPWGFPSATPTWQIQPASRLCSNWQPVQSDGAGETWQRWVKWRHQLQQQRGLRREGTEGVPVSRGACWALHSPSGPAYLPCSRACTLPVSYILLLSI